jgi:hypothetical protein
MVDDWYKLKKPMFDLENQIIDEKLKQGVNGLEWLVLQTQITETKMRMLSNWIEFVSKDGYDVEAIMKDAITMDVDSFYSKYELNWWIAIDETLSYLSLLRQQDYDRYLNFICDIDRCDVTHEGQKA